MKRIRMLTVFILLLFAMALSCISPAAVRSLKVYCCNLPKKHIDLIKEDKTTVKLREGDYVLFGRYTGEPILWKVVETDGKVLIISEKIICFKAFDACGTDENYHTSRDAMLFGSGEWSDSTLAQWLNSDQSVVDFSHCPPEKQAVCNEINSYADESGFLCDNNFTPEEKELIDSEGVFLPERKVLEKYFDKSQLQKGCTVSAAYKNESPFFLTYTKNVWYWTSTPVKHNSSGVVAVTSSGGFYKSLAYDSEMGVCPAMYLKKNSVVSEGGNGTAEKPYVVSGGGYES